MKLSFVTANQRIDNSGRSKFIRTDSLYILTVPEITRAQLGCFQERTVLNERCYSKQGMTLNKHFEEKPLGREASMDVQEFYESYPYPRPIDSLASYTRTWNDPLKRRADFHLFWPSRSYTESQSILVAGCGTSQAAKHAMRWPHAQVTGIDFSSTSVRCTEDLKRAHNVSNLQVHQLDVEQAGQLDHCFDQIVCTGVLHHLKDPDAGLRALRSVLKPGGALHLMVYAPYGRTGIYMLQEFCRRIGIHATDADIRDLISALSMLPPGHPLENLLHQAPDFRHEAALADALLHPQDRAYSVPQLLDFIEKGGLRFGRWIKQAPYSIHCGVIASLPQADRLSRLSLAEQYAAIELFRGTMLRHSLVAYGDDGPSDSQISFAGVGWLEYVPIRMSETICVQERLPAGAAAVLINQSHTYRDLFLPIGPIEKQLFDAIDGNRSIREIAEETSSHTKQSVDLEMTRTFFERLWWHDQVVFDASPTCL
jgi:2-polyprenyl-3-methyl-5-hydroxy-6-metoxy-1,4-benzoquinol methylase